MSLLKENSTMHFKAGLKKILLVIFSVFLLLLLFLEYQKEMKLQNLAYEEIRNAEWYFDLPRARIENNSEPKGSELIEPYQDFRLKKYSASAKKLRFLLLEDPGNEKYSLFLAFSLLAQLEIDESLEMIQTCMESDDKFIRQDAEWLLSLYFILQDEKKKSIELMEQLIEQRSNYFNEAKAILPLLKASM